MKYPLVIFLLFMVFVVDAATVTIYNKSDKPVAVGLLYSDKGASSSALKTGTAALGWMSGNPVPAVYAASRPTTEITEYKKETIMPGKSVYLNSGLNPITAIDFVPEGSREKVTFNPHIGSMALFQKIEYGGPNDIKKL